MILRTALAMSLDNIISHFIHLVPLPIVIVSNCVSWLLLRCLVLNYFGFTAFVPIIIFGPVSVLISVYCLYLQLLVIVYYYLFDATILIVPA
jgi:hypothetical protein